MAMRSFILITVFSILGAAYSCIDTPPTSRVHAWNDGFYAVVSARRESVPGASKRHVFTAVGRSGLGLHSPFLVFFHSTPPGSD